MTSVNMADYWPLPALGRELLVQDVTGAGTLMVLRKYRRIAPVSGIPVVRLDEYTEAGWVSAWEYRHDPTHGVIETANRFPGVFQPYKTGKWIIWGGQMAVGQTVQQGVEVDLRRATGVTQGPGNFGWQSVTLVAVHPTFTNAGGMTFANVAEIKVVQSWCKTWTCDFPAGQNVFDLRYWLAPGLGMIQVDYDGADARIDYARSTTEVLEMRGAQ
jgi:hypothetical protein